MNRMISILLMIGLYTLTGVQEIIAVGGECDSCTKPLKFRAMFILHTPISGRDADPDHPEKCEYLMELNRKLSTWSEEGFNAVIWLCDAELYGINGGQALARMARFPEARELPPELNEKYISQMKWLLRCAKERGMDNYFYVNLIQYPKAFAKAHGLDRQLPVSPTVHHFHNGGYGGDPNMTNLGVRNELTRSFTEELFLELLEIYEDVDGFYGCMGETVPGKRSSYYAEAIVPALKRSGRNPLFILHQWQIPLDDYLEDIVQKKVYDNTWLGFHAYNSEQITDAKPYPGLLLWAESTAMPTVATLMPSNIRWFPFNSPKFAAEIVAEMKRIQNFKGYMYREFGPPALSPLFRKALAYYSKTEEAYSDEPWVTMLEKEYGDRAAAKHFLQAFNLSGYIIPETSALIFHASNGLLKELQLPYAFVKGEYGQSWMTSPARGNYLIPVREYARMVARDPERFEDKNGSDWTRPPYKQEVIWGVEGGSLYEVIPPVHMGKIRKLGEECLQEANLGLATIKRNEKAALRTIDYMKAYMLFARYYERKVAAGTKALIYADGHRETDRIDAEKLADEALACYIEAATFYNDKMEGSPELLGRKAEMPSRIENEKKERQDLAKLFNWPTTAAASTLIVISGSPARTE